MQQASQTQKALQTSLTVVISDCDWPLLGFLSLEIIGFELVSGVLLHVPQEVLIDRRCWRWVPDVGGSYVAQPAVPLSCAGRYWEQEINLKG